MMETGILKKLAFDHIGISVSNLETVQRFYSQVLGFTTQEEEFRIQDHNIRGVVLVNDQGVRVELFERKGSRATPPADPTESTLTQGMFQFALSVSDVHSAFARATSLGAASVMSPRIAPDGRTLFAFIGDPDGNLIEFIQRESRLK